MQDEDKENRRIRQIFAIASGSKLARALDVSRQAVSYVMTGQRTMPEAWRKKILDLVE